MRLKAVVQGQPGQGAFHPGAFQVSAPQRAAKDPGGADRGELAVGKQGKGKACPVEGERSFPRADAPGDALDALRGGNGKGDIPLGAANAVQGENGQGIAVVRGDLPLKHAALREELLSEG